MTLFEKRIWKRLASFGKATFFEGRMRLDFMHVPEKLRERALKIRVPCVACGQLIHPLRVRQASGRVRINTDPLYYSASCPTPVNAGCSRTKQAKRHMDWCRANIENV